MNDFFIELTNASFDIIGKSDVKIVKCYVRSSEILYYTESDGSFESKSRVYLKTPPPWIESPYFLEDCEHIKGCFSKADANALQRSLMQNAPASDKAPVGAF